MSARITDAMVEAGARSLRQRFSDRTLTRSGARKLPLWDDARTLPEERALYLSDMRAALAAALSTEPGEADPFEHCAKEAEARAELVEQMRGVYPGDPTGALGRDANKLRRLAKSIRQLRPAAPLPKDTREDKP